MGSANIQPDTTSNFINVAMRDTSGALTTVAYTGITVTYHRPGAAVTTESSIVHGTIGSFNAKSWKVTSKTGVHQYCPSNAAIAAGVPYVDFYFDATGCITTRERVWLMGVPNVAAGGSGGLPILGENSYTICSFECTGSSPAISLFGASGKPAMELNSGTNYSSVIDFYSYPSGILTSWNVPASVQAIASNAITAPALATDAVDEIKDAIWNAAKSSYTTSGTFGYYLDAKVSEAGGGGGGDATAANQAKILDILQSKQ